MKKGWRVILGIVLVALIVGGVCIGVGLLTGADSARISQNLDEHYHLNTIVEAYLNYGKELVQYFVNQFNSFFGI